MKRILSLISLAVLCLGMALSQDRQSDQDAKIAVNSSRITTLDAQMSHLQNIGETVASMKATLDSDHQLIWTLLVATLLNVLSGLLKPKSQDIVEKIKARSASASS